MKLYVIGNGFDLHHGLDTKYTSFGRYLKKNYYETYNLLLEHFGFEDLQSKPSTAEESPLWSEFETNLSGLSTQSVLEACSDLLPHYASETFRDRDRYNFQYEVERIVDLLTTKLIKAFSEFIRAVDYPISTPFNILNLEKNAHYLNFNYTETLSKYYNIPSEKISFIHGRAADKNKKLRLGHGINPANFQPKPCTPPEGQSGEEYEQWFQDQADQFDHSYDLGEQEIYKYFSKSFKDAPTNITEKNYFFSQIGDIDEIYILGHSMAEVDMPYFIKLKHSIPSNAKWIVTCRSLKSKDRYVKILQNIGVINVTCVSMSNI